MPSTSETARTVAFARGASVENSLFYMGSLMSVLASTDETGGAFSLLEYRSQPGHEPPPHIHLGQDEILYILEGEIEAYTADLTAAVVGAGQSLFLPRDQAHAWYVTSPRLRMLIMTNPAGIDSYFATMAEPATSLELPPGSVTYVMDDPARAIEIGARHGLRILTPDETRELLPNYPGFGATVAERRAAAAA
ncbi:cupin domain-containing protein [Aureimonas leprariae]|uniref:Cupin domain-containing protein n=1 Tax=Plantimonas leprariae TaxID=2615207 RepID=A0A7V7PM16_9HYPH|nr:cupin domain-containing protein [Aureimonas leprariae]KAB0677541.1 cupin domain-containing protein [Aureimonas leprariae]